MGVIKRYVLCRWNNVIIDAAISIYGLALYVSLLIGVDATVYDSP